MTQRRRRDTTEYCRSPAGAWGEGGRLEYGRAGCVPVFNGEIVYGDVGGKVDVR